MEEIEIKEWIIYPLDKSSESIRVFNAGCIDLRFKIKGLRDEEKMLTDEELKILEEDLKDLGKWRKFRELKKDLENE